MAESQATMTYPTKSQHDRWKAQADDMDMSLSEFIQAMTEAGLKKFDASVEPDETNQELRDQRNELKTELDQARKRIDKLERQLYQDEREAIVQHVEDNPGATYGEIGQHLADTVPDRLPDLLDLLEGDELRNESDGYYPLEEA